jgi:hypothetical protein
VTTSTFCNSRAALLPSTRRPRDPGHATPSEQGQDAGSDASFCRRGCQLFKSATEPAAAQAFLLLLRRNFDAVGNKQLSMGKVTMQIVRQVIEIIATIKTL